MMVRSILLFVASITLIFAQRSHSSNFFDKRSTKEWFEGMRGTRSFALSSSEDLLKRAPMGFQGTRGKKSSIIADVENQLFPDSMEKRAPMGFQGTRGKKDNPLTNFEALYSPNDYEKRTPMGFQGTRGKKALSEDEYYKRAPMGFQGMRGKKSLEQILDDIEKRIATRFHDSAGKHMYSIDYPDYGRTSSSIDRYRNYLDKSEFLREWKKRARMGFQGTRGKKTTFDTLDELDKRGVINFHGAQDTNDTLDNYLDYSYNPVSYEKRSLDFQDAGGDSLKRARMGFHGMRGKRDATKIYEYNSSSAITPMDYQGINDQGRRSLPVYTVEKRSPYRYLGARGKKNPRWEFRGKFVGVRGKKSSIVNAIARKQAVF